MVSAVAVKSAEGKLARPPQIAPSCRRPRVRLRRDRTDTAIGVESSVERPETRMARRSKCGSSIPLTHSFSSAFDVAYSAFSASSRK